MNYYGFAAMAALFVSVSVLVFVIVKRREKYRVYLDNSDCFNSCRAEGRGETWCKNYCGDYPSYSVYQQLQGGLPTEFW